MERWEVWSPFKAATVFKEVKAFIREMLEETREPRVGELPNKPPSLGNRELEGGASALAITECHIWWGCPCPALWHESCVEPHRLFQELGTLGKSLTSLCLNFCILFLTYLTEVVWRFTCVCSVCQPSSGKHYLDHTLDRIRQTHRMSTFDVCWGQSVAGSLLHN